MFWPNVLRKLPRKERMLVLQSCPCHISVHQLLTCHQTIPQVNFLDIAGGTVPRDTVDAIRRTGVAVVRGVVPKDVAKALLDDVRDYFSKHDFKGFPADAKEKVIKFLFDCSPE